MSLLAVSDLAVSYWRGDETVRAVDGVSFSVARGERLGVVGESGSGKTTLALALLGVLPQEATIDRGAITFDGRDLTKENEVSLSAIRGKRIGLVFQEPLSALNPVYTVGAQLVEAIRLHRDVGRREARDLAVALFERVRMPDPKTTFDAYPHECSGGMRQRALIAIAICHEPALLVADEPTSALDGMTSAHIVALLEELSEASGMALLLISHSLPVIARLTTHALVMFGGRVIERGRASEIVTAPLHPYTQALVRALPETSGRGYRVRGTPTARLGSVFTERTLSPTGCAYQNLCPERREACERLPPLIEVPEDRLVRCVLHAKKPAKGPLLVLDDEANE